MREMKEQRQKVKKEHDTRYPEVEEHPLTNGHVYEDQMDNNESPHNLQQQQQTQEGLQANELQKERMETKPSLVVFRPLELQVPTNRLGSIEGQPFKFGLGNIIIQELGSFEEGSKYSTTQIVHQNLWER